MVAIHSRVKAGMSFESGIGYNAFTPDGVDVYSTDRAHVVGGQTMEQLGEKVAAHEATLGQMNERIGSIESRLTSIETRLSGLESRMLYVGGALALLMSIYKFL
jgi:hypothetical protein